MVCGFYCLPWGFEMVIKKIWKHWWWLVSLCIWVYFFNKSDLFDMTDTLFQVASKQTKFWGISNKNVGGAAHTVWWNSLNTKMLHSNFLNDIWFFIWQSMQTFDEFPFWLKEEMGYIVIDGRIGPTHFNSWIFSASSLKQVCK